MKHFLGKFPDNTKTIQPKIVGKCRDPRKMHTTLLEMRTAKSMPVMTVMQNFGVFNVSNENENSDSEFVYLDEKNFLLQNSYSHQLLRNWER